MATMLRRMLLCIAVLPALVLWLPGCTQGEPGAGAGGKDSSAGQGTAPQTSGSEATEPQPHEAIEPALPDAAAPAKPTRDEAPAPKDGDAEPAMPAAQGPTAQAYACESCGHKFGIPLDLPLKDRVFPPIVCPKCGKPTAVRATLYTPRGGGEPVVWKYEKYSDEQLKRLQEYRAADLDPEDTLLEEGDCPMVRYADSNKWFSPLKEPRELRSFDVLRGKFKSIIPVFPDGWPVIGKDKLKQR